MRERPSGWETRTSGGESGNDTKIDQHNNSVARSFAVRNWWSMLRWYYSGNFWWNLYYYALVYINKGYLKTRWP